MVLTRAAVEKMSKEELVNMVLNYDKTMESTLADLNKEISKINKNFEKIESELSMTVCCQFGQMVECLLTN